MALATESTRNGMSSLTMPMRMRRLPASPPVDSINSASSPGLRVAASSARNSAASRSVSRVKPWVSPGSAFPVNAFLIDSTKGGSRRWWAVMGRYCSGKAGRRRGYRPGVATATSPSGQLNGAADRPFDQRWVIDARDGLVTAVGVAAGGDADWPIHPAEFYPGHGAGAATLG